MNNDISQNQQTIPILDFGAQYVQLIARRVREAGVYAVLVRPDISVEELRKLNPVGIILSGGPASVYEAGAPKCDPKLFDIGVPILGICYGMQIATQLLGGDVESRRHMRAREYGRTQLKIGGAGGDLMAGIPQDTTVWMSHGDQVQELGPDFLPLASTPTCPLAAMRHKDRPFFGVQFHPEVTHTPHGTQIIENFVYKICKAAGTWKMGNFVEASGRGAIRKAGVRTASSGTNVICGLSGGVDIHLCWRHCCIRRLVRSFGAYLWTMGCCGKMRRPSVETTFRDHFKMDLRVVDARQAILEAAFPA